MEAVGGTGSIRYPDGTVETLPPLITLEEQYPMHRPSENLVEVCLGLGPNGSPPEIGWRTVELLDAAYRSAGLGGQPVEIASLYK
jgi:hypothetical protein